MLTPNTVTLIAPDAATLAIVTLLGPGASIVIDPVRLFTCHPVVMAMRRSVHTPMTVLGTIELSDRHSVISDALPPTRLGLL